MDRRQFIKSALAVAAAIPYGLQKGETSCPLFRDSETRNGDSCEDGALRSVIAGESIEPGDMLVIGDDGKAYRWQQYEDGVVLGAAASKSCEQERVPVYGLEGPGVE